MKEKKGSIIQTLAGLVILIAGIVLCINTYVVKGNKAYAVSLLTAIVGAVTTSVNAVIAVVVASIIYLALRPVMKKSDMLRDL